MLSSNSLDWYLIRTKPHKERWVHGQLRDAVAEVFLPLLKTRAPQFGRMASAIVPLFPCYLFARCDLKAKYFEIKYTPGVQGLVSAGKEPLAVPVAIIDEIKRRGVDGIVDLPPPRLDRGDKVRVVDGPFRGFEAVFERYLSGSERVAILLDTIEAKGVRMLLPAGFVAHCS